MRIIFARLLVLAMPLAAGQQVAASDLIMNPVQQKQFSRFSKCVNALKQKRQEYLLLQPKTTESPDGSRVTVMPVTEEIRFPSKAKAEFRFTFQTLSQGPAREDGQRPSGRWASGIDWRCEGRVLWMQEQSSAYVPSPLPPIAPQQPANQSTSN